MLSKHIGGAARKNESLTSDFFVSSIGRLIVLLPFVKYDGAELHRTKVEIVDSWKQVARNTKSSALISFNYPRSTKLPPHSYSTMRVNLSKVVLDRIVKGGNSRIQVNSFVYSILLHE